MNSEQQQQRIMGYFIEEAREHLQTIEQGVLNLHNILDEPESINELFRAAHSIKGGAAMLGVGSIQHVAHRLEDFFKILKENPQINVDERLKSLLLAGFDPLAELLDELQIGFRISDELTQEISNRVKPVFTELESHINQLTSNSNEQVVSPILVDQKVVQQEQLIVQPKTFTSQRAIFQEEITNKMRDMLQIFRGVDSQESRSQLLEICNYFQEVGNRLELSNWTNLANQIKNLIAYPINSYQILAPIVIRELKDAQDLVLANREAEIATSQQIQTLLSNRFSEEKDDDVSTIFTTTTSFPSEAASIEEDLKIIDDLESGEYEALELDSINPVTQQSHHADEINLFSNQEKQEEVFDLSEIHQEQIDQMSWMDSEYEITENQHIDGPKVGASELKTLATLFENDAIDFDVAWQDIESNEINLAKHGNDQNFHNNNNNHDEFADLLDNTSTDLNIPVSNRGLEDANLEELFGDLATDEQTSTIQDSQDLCPKDQESLGLFPEDMDIISNPTHQSISKNSPDSLEDLVISDLATEKSVDIEFDDFDLGINIIDQISDINTENAEVINTDDEDFDANDTSGLNIFDELGFDNDDFDQEAESLVIDHDDDKVEEPVFLDQNEFGEIAVSISSDDTSEFNTFLESSRTNELDVDEFSDIDDINIDDNYKINDQPVNEPIDQIDVQTDVISRLSDDTSKTNSVSQTIDSSEDLHFFDTDSSNANRTEQEIITTDDLGDFFADVESLNLSLSNTVSNSVTSDITDNSFQNIIDREFSNTNALGDFFDDVEDPELDSIYSDNELDVLDKDDEVSDVSVDLSENFIDDNWSDLGVSDKININRDVVDESTEELESAIESNNLVNSFASANEDDLTILENKFNDFGNDLDYESDFNEERSLTQSDVISLADDSEENILFDDVDDVQSDSLQSDNNPLTNIQQDDVNIDDNQEDISASSTFNSLDNFSQGDNDVEELNGIDDNFDFDDLEAMIGEPGSLSDNFITSNKDEIASFNNHINQDNGQQSINSDDMNFDELEALIDDTEGGEIPLDAKLKEQETTTLKTASPTLPKDDFDELESMLQSRFAPDVGPLKTKTPVRPPVTTRKPKLSDSTMRVDVKYLDSLNNLVGELVVNRNLLEQEQERLQQFITNLLHQVQLLSDVSQRMRDQYDRSLLEASLTAGRGRLFNNNFESGYSGDGVSTTSAVSSEFEGIEFDRYNTFHVLSQEIIELIVKVRESASDIEFVVGETDQVTRQLGTITTQVQDDLKQSRMVPFAQITDRLPRGVRDRAIKSGKLADLEVFGRETLIDKAIMESLIDPLTHLVNNAIDHGLEDPKTRQAVGKPATGKLTVRAYHQGNQTVISISDDGAGISTEKVKKSAVAKGVRSQSEVDRLNDTEVYLLLFEAGFSTAAEADEFKGRGVGLDVVKTCLDEIRGVIIVESAVGKGTTFTIRLPLTLSISKAMFCISDRARIAFPVDGFEDMVEVPQSQIVLNEKGQPCLPWRDTVLPFQHLSNLLSYSRHLSRSNIYGKQDNDELCIIILRNDNSYLALQVDQFLGEYEIVIKQLEGPIPKPAGIAGATVLGDGRVMAIANVLELFDIASGRLRPSTRGVTLQPPIEEVVAVDPTVLIVDDSITVRELLSLTFAKVGYRVEQAKDGQDAWEKLRAGLPCDMIFCDIEMPRMDGLDLLSRLQKDSRLKDIPVAMLTSRGADRHRQTAIQLGAKGYFTKPYLEEELLSASRRLLNGETLTI